MALTKCPECSQSVSTEAISCPHCGYSLRQKERREPPFVDRKGYVRLRRREEQLSRETYDPFLGKEMNPKWGYIAAIILIKLGKLPALPGDSQSLTFPGF